MMETEQYVKDLEKQVRDLKEQIQSGNEMFRMTTQHLQRVQNELKESEAELKKTNRHLTDSITYAKHIQHAFITENENLVKMCPQSFLFFRPKDILSGDFLWIKQNQSNITIAVGDCTGHGVPGAMLTVFMTSSLNQIHTEVGHNPAELLSRLDDYVVSDLKNSTENVNDSAEIAVINYNRDTHKLTFAGANRPLVQVRDGEVLRTKGSRYILGFRKRRKEEMVNKIIDVKEDDMIYLFSDGFPDQFGGPDNMKYSSKRFRKLLQRVADLPLNEQLSKVSDEFDSWKNNQTQTDDTILLGLKINALTI